MINFIPVSKSPFQNFRININNQNCIIELMQKRTGLFFSIAVNDVFILRNILCENINPLIMYKYLKFSGNLFFVDTEGDSNPDFTGLGDRFILVYSDEI